MLYNKHTTTKNFPSKKNFFISMKMSQPLLSKSSPNHQYEAIPDNSQHEEHHFESPEIIRDIVLGLSDGLTV